MLSQVLENVKEMWLVLAVLLATTLHARNADVYPRRTEAPKSKNRKPVNKDRFISKMCTARLRLPVLRTPLTILACCTQSCEETPSCLVSATRSPLAWICADLVLPYSSP